MDVVLLKQQVKDILKEIDINAVTVKALQQQLTERHQHDFNNVENKNLLKQIVGDILSEQDQSNNAAAAASSNVTADIQPTASTVTTTTTTTTAVADVADQKEKSDYNDNDGDGDDAGSEKDEAEDADKHREKRTRKSSSSRKRVSKSTNGSTSNSGVNKRYKWGEQNEASTLRSGAEVYTIDEPLQKVIFVSSDSRMNAVKMLWQYIRANKLVQKTKVQLDDNLKAIFKEEVMTESQINKKIDEHLFLNGTTLSELKSKKAKKSKKTVPELGPDGQPIEPPKSKKKTGFNKPKVLSKPLADFLGQESMSRGDIVKAINEYVRKHDLQDKSDGRVINFDERLQQVFKVKKTTFFKLSKLLTKHVADASEWT